MCGYQALATLGRGESRRTSLISPPCREALEKTADSKASRWSSKPTAAVGILRPRPLAKARFAEFEVS